MTNLFKLQCSGDVCWAFRDLHEHFKLPFSTANVAITMKKYSALLLFSVKSYATFMLLYEVKSSIKLVVKNISKIHLKYIIAVM